MDYINLNDIIKRNNNYIDEIFMKIAFNVSLLSKDLSTKVGAILVSPDKRSVSIGYNGFPPGFPDKKSWIENRNNNHLHFTKYDLTNHAERNAIDQCHTSDLSGWSLYCTHKPCLDCARAIVTKKIKFIFWSIGPDQITMDIKSDKVDLLFKISDVEQKRINI
jgi:dCMP deaminase